METQPITTIQDQLADQLRRRIWTGDLMPGERLREIELANRFGVSRGPIRDVFLRLSREGLLEAKPNVGVSVSQPVSKFKRRALVQLRRTLECRALSAAFRDGPDALAEHLASNLDPYELACRKDRLDEVVRLDMEFHRVIVAAADGGSLISVWLPIVSQMSLRYSRHALLSESYHEHEAILDAVRSGDRAEAVSLLRGHIV